MQPSTCKVGAGMPNTSQITIVGAMLNPKPRDVNHLMCGGLAGDVRDGVVDCCDYNHGQDWAWGKAIINQVWFKMSLCWFRDVFLCFGWDPQHQTTGARVLVGTPSTKPQTRVFWLGPPAPNHRRTCFGWDPQHLRCWDKVLVLGSDSKNSKTHLESRFCVILIDNLSLTGRRSRPACTLNRTSPALRRTAASQTHARHVQPMC